MRVMLAEDDPDIQETLAALLRDEGFTVDACSNGQEAMTLGLNHDYHAVILDPGLPIFSGEQVLARWRERGRRFPVIVVTGTRYMREDVRNLIRLGMSHYTQKPVADLGILIEWVKSFANGDHGGGDTLVHGEIVIGVQDEVVRYKGRRVTLSRNEFLVLLELVRAAGSPLTVRMLASRCFADDTGAKDLDIGTYVKRIREKFGAQVIVRAGAARGYVLA
ncbi:MAG TPA: response regulator transcription factor [Vicinamibacterales bacterium]|jgi:DNA-binding response OmpR family regulator|nr:response regulator transcription factor [Vicinamibacterales bacterium]